VLETAIVGLIGPNGAGKTTLMDAICGFVATSGTVCFAGRPIEGMMPHQRARLGIGRTFQAMELWEDLSVSENIVAGLAAARHRHSSRDQLDRTIDLLGLQSLRDRPVRELSRGQRQLVSIGRALIGQPRLLVLDEPAGGLDTSESAWRAERLRVVRASGVTILLIDHDMSLVLGFCDQIQVMDFGAVIASGSPSEIRSDPAVVKAYLGSMHAEELGAVP
jgi:ABC-type branched-subunit amino acid transport system ATPase component